VVSMTATKDVCSTKGCTSTPVITKENKKFNDGRLAEQKEIRKPGEEFYFNFLYTCPLHGQMFLKKLVRRK
jgi:hypothetical protein